MSSQPYNCHAYLQDIIECCKYLLNFKVVRTHCRFIPGTAASAVNYQAYLLVGISRWNSARQDSTINMNLSTTLRSHDLELKHNVKFL